MKTVPALAAMVLALNFRAEPASAAVRYAAISGNTAGSENGCPVWVLTGDDGDDCSYDAGMPLNLGASQWVGPLFSAGYYAPGAAPLEFTNPVVDPGPVSAAAPVLAIGGKTGIPVTRGFISIDDRDTPAAIDDIIGGTLEFGAFERNVAVGATARQVERIDRVIHRLVPARVSSANANGSGGQDYVIALAGSEASFPAPLGGSTTAGGGVADSFPSEVGSQSSPDPADQPYWTSPPGSHGLARLDGESAVLGTRSSASVWGYSCDDGDGPPGPDGCLTHGLNWDGDGRAAFSNVLLRIATNADGDVVDAQAYVVNEADVDALVAGTDSWTATSLAFSGTATEPPLAFDDRNVLTNSLPSVTTDVLANDLPGTAPVTVDILTPPAAGTATVTANRIQYVPALAPPPESEQVVVYRITDASQATATAELHILVTDPISCGNDEATGVRDQTTTVDVLANDTGFDLPPVTLTIVSPPAEGTAVVDPDRRISFTPPPATGGTYTLAYRLNDGSNRPASCTLSIRVPALPQAVDDVAGLAVDVATSIDVLANDLQVTDTPLTLAIVDAPDHGTATIDTSASTPVVRYVPAAGYVGGDTFSYTITDDDSDTSNVATVTLSVFGAPQNDVPACAADSASTDRGVPVTVDVLANDTGLNALPLVLEVIGVGPADAGSAVVEADDTITFTPAAEAGGSIQVGYRVREALNAAVQCLLVVRIDDQPAATDNSVDALNFGQAAVVRVLNNDTGLSDTPQTLVITQPPVHGTVRICDAPGSDCPGFVTGALPFVVYVYDDASGYPAVDTFAYRVTDADGDASDEATVTVTPRNQLLATDDPDGGFTTSTGFRTASGSAVRLDVLSNDGGFLQEPITVTIEPGVEGGRVSVNGDDTVTFTANDGFTGLATFTYRIEDATGQSDTAEVSVAVYPGPVTDSGGSAIDAWLAAMLVLAAIWRRPEAAARRGYR